MAGTTKLGLATQAAIGRDARGRIVLDATSWERPAVTVRVPLTPREAATLRDELDALLSQQGENEIAYAHEIATEGYEEVMA